MNDKLMDIIRELVAFAKEDDGEHYFEIVSCIAALFPRNLEEQLLQLVNGPVYDGDIISKTNREALFSLGLAVRVCCKGEQGYTGAQYIGYSILKEMTK